MDALQTYNVKQAGAILGRGEDWVRKKVRDGKLAGYIDGIQIRIPRHALEEYQAEARKRTIEQIKTKSGMYGVVPAFRRKKVSIAA